MYEALLGPAVVRIRTEVSKSPVFQQAMAKLDRGAKQLPKVSKSIILCNSVG